MRQGWWVIGDRFLIVTGSAQTTRDFDWISRHIAPTEHAILTDISALYCVLSVMGPNADTLLARVSGDAFATDPLKFSWTRLIDLGFARLRAARMSYVGGPGYELYVPVEMTRHAYQPLTQADAEIGPGETPFEAGMMFAVKLDKTTPFIGQQALLEKQGQPLRKKLVRLVLDDPADYAWGGETIFQDGQAMGEIASAGRSPKADACVGLDYARGEAALCQHHGTVSQIELWGDRRSVRLFDL